MNINFSELKRLNSFVSGFSSQINFETQQLGLESADSLMRYLFFILDALFKSEGFYKKRNLIPVSEKGFITDDLVELATNIRLYLQQFDTRIFSFTRTERQTFVFVLENLVDYMRSGELYTEGEDKQNLFRDYRFWIENFLKICDQKITGSVYSSKKVNLKNLFNTGDTVKNGLVYSNSTVNFSTFPFVVGKGSSILFLTGITQDELLYTDIDSQKVVKIKNKSNDVKVFEYLLANFDFTNQKLVKERLKEGDSPLYEMSEVVENAYLYHKEGLFSESFSRLKDLSMESLDLPLVYLLQIKNLVNLNRMFEVKRIMQRFILFYPYYVEGYEIMGDVYFKEDNLDMALNFYEKVLRSTQSKRVSEKVKKLKDSIVKGKSKVETADGDYYFDITAKALQGDDEIMSRDRELREMIEVLISNSRRNLLLVGESGVGKSSLIKLLAQKILDGEVPDSLKDKRVKEINFVTLLTGSKYRGQFEKKVLKLLQDFSKQKSILVLEDIHMMIASGVVRGTSMDLVNILKQFLRENTVQVIATTNYEEYKNSLEKDNVLLGFFQRINIDELSREDTCEILKNLARNVFLKENMVISEEAVEDIVEGAKRNIKDKKLPDAAVMVLERAVAKVKYKIHMGETSKYKVDRSDVVEVLADMLNLPESNISISLKARLINLQAALQEEIVGQDEAVEKVSAGIITSKMNFDIKPNRPDGVFLFIGPTGVGKTETAIALTKALYGSEDYLVRIDMSEYMEKFTYSRFVGAAPGYVGYTDTNQLSDKVRQNPYSVILLDEIEKADSQLLNIFLQVFDAGRLTDARGHVVDFSHTTIIMTSNIGTSLFSRSQVGYHGDIEGSSVSRVSLIKSLKKFFSPEFLNRVDEIVVFNHLEEESVRKIIDIQLQGTRQNLLKQDKELIVRDEVVDYIVKNGYSKEYGARNISRTLKNKVLEKLARASLEKEWDYANCIVCFLDDNGDVEVRLEPAGSEPIKDRHLLEQNLKI